MAVHIYRDWKLTIVELFFAEKELLIFSTRFLQKGPETKGNYIEAPQHPIDEDDDEDVPPARHRCYSTHALDLEQPLCGREVDEARPRRASI
jgi:hypothetical protein